MKVFTVNKHTHQKEQIEADQIIFDTENDGPTYRITAKNNGTIAVREISHLALTIKPGSANSIIIGATE